MPIGTAQEGRALALRAQALIDSGSKDVALLQSYITQLTEYADTYPNLSSSFQAYIAELNGAITKAGDTSQPTGATASAGDVVGGAAKARDDGAATTTPPATTTQEGRVFQANQVNQNLETGTNAPVKTTTQTQSTPAPGPNATGPQTTTSAGAAAPRDDNTGPTSNSTQQLINDAFGPYGLIKPQPNVLDQYASYTYKASVYN